MKFFDVAHVLKQIPGVTGIARRAWNGKAFIALSGDGNLFLQIGTKCFMYAFSFEDAIADDWEPL